MWARADGLGEGAGDDAPLVLRRGGGGVLAHAGVVRGQGEQPRRAAQRDRALELKELTELTPEEQAPLLAQLERYEDLEQILERLQSLGVEVLRNRALEADGIQFIGIDDHGDPEQVARVLPFIEVSRELYSILLYHRPHGLEAAHRHGIDLKLSGHTHAGQIVPFHMAVNRVFEYTRGLYQHDNTWLYVNEGTGTWGPTLRLGTRSEITLFEISPGQVRGE